MPTKAELQARIEILEKENASLKGMLARAERGLSGNLLPEELPPADIPDRVSRWMKSFGLPWETFWCYDHRRWGNDSNLLIVFYVQIMPDDFVMQLHRF